MKLWLFISNGSGVIFLYTLNSSSDKRIEVGKQFEVKYFAGVFSLAFSIKSVTVCPRHILLIF